MKRILLGATLSLFIVGLSQAEEVRVPYDSDGPLEITIDFQHDEKNKNRARHRLITESDSERNFRSQAKANFEKKCREECPEECEYVGYEGGHVCLDEDGVEQPLETEVTKRRAFSDLFKASTSGPLCGVCIYDCADELAQFVY